MKREVLKNLADHPFSLFDRGYDGPHPNHIWIQAVSENGTGTNHNYFAPLAERVPIDLDGQLGLDALGHATIELMERKLDFRPVLPDQFDITMVLSEDLRSSQFFHGTCALNGKAYSGVKEGVSLMYQFTGYQRFSFVVFDRALNLPEKIDEDGFYLRIAHALSSCQLVEQELKLYLTEAFDLVQRSVEGKVVFTFSGRDYENASLERLIEGFKRLTDNDALIRKLRKFKDERNFLSHRAITHCLDPDGELDRAPLTGIEERIESIERDAASLREEILVELNQIRVHTEFDRSGSA